MVVKIDRACACKLITERIWHLLIDQRSRRAVEVGGQFAEGKSSMADLEKARFDAYLAANDVARDRRGRGRFFAAQAAACMTDQIVGDEALTKMAAALASERAKNADQFQKFEEEEMDRLRIEFAKLLRARKGDKLLDSTYRPDGL